MYKVKYFKENLIDEKIIDELAYIKNNDLLYNLSNLNIPSRVIYYYNENDEKIISEIDYLYNGRFHRENSPAPSSSPPPCLPKGCAACGACGRGGPSPGPSPP